MTRNFVGARGIDVILTTGGASTSTAYPLYDCHGNMVATLTKNTAGTAWSTGNLREYDAWGTVRNGQQTGSPANRYCANLGHIADDESGLTYMRARYYEPTTGRFINEDPARDSWNWYAYANSRPSALKDSTGLFTFGDVMTGATDDVAEKLAELRQAGATLSWASNMLLRAMSAWARQAGPELAEALYGESVKQMLINGTRIQLIGVSGRMIALQLQGDNIVVKTYNYLSEHIVPDVVIPQLLK